MEVLVFGQLTDITGSTSLQLPTVASSDELREMLHTQFPSLKSITYLIAINKKIAKQNMVIDQHAEIALLPPFSGG
ncbi:molybdopterin synthase catalytic subunit/molybdopterin synthase sulfur carrier subunit [Chitinophaga skermanii]|uniref:Molybdopterin synthase catalytic subunit/molybdopterin synthase sulfur carrier subunit n=1 Tax=Chitinophaga skermanii TaxID=331697 RepID=A0A327Q263_9BACT|nr:MoaD/ThiS family protein [Chitinophaga skermanii]RAI97837.1 molybdopterin synthase catalytic subunit/molybdopterin synthase sulfur carrier subunit [Chitinophaga skermanii]